MKTLEYPTPHAMATVFDHHTKDSRKRLLVFLSTVSKEDFVRAFPEAGRVSIRDHLVHTIDASRFWINLIRNRPYAPLNLGDFQTLESILPVVDETAEQIHGVLKDADREWFASETTVMHNGEVIRLVPAMAVVHMLTHEYHHKGQIVMLARRLGYQPPDTDLL